MKKYENYNCDFLKVCEYDSIHECNKSTQLILRFIITLCEITVGLKFDKNGQQCDNMLGGFIYYYDTNRDGKENEYSTFGHLSEVQIGPKHKFCITMQYNPSKSQVIEIIDGSFEIDNNNGKYIKNGVNTLHKSDVIQKKSKTRKYYCK